MSFALFVVKILLQRAQDFAEKNEGRNQTMKEDNKDEKRMAWQDKVVESAREQGLPPEAIAHYEEIKDRMISMEEAAALLIEEYEKENPDEFI